MNESDERRLVEEIILGDERAFEMLFKLYHPIVYSVTHAIIGGKDEVEDLVQEIFMKILKGLIRFRFDSRLSTWIYTIARNHSINHLKRMQLQRTSMVEAFETIEKQGKNPEKSMISKETRKIVQEALKSLDENHRIALELRYMSEKSYEEISSIMDIPMGTVKTYIHRAKARLKRTLSEQTKEETNNG